MDENARAEINSLHARLDSAANALTQVSEQLLTAGMSIIVLRGMLAALVNLSPPGVREAFKRTLQDVQPSDAISGLPRAEFFAARERLMDMLD